MLQEVVDLGEASKCNNAGPKLGADAYRQRRAKYKNGRSGNRANPRRGITRIGEEAEEMRPRKRAIPAVIVVAPPIRPWLARMVKQRFPDTTVLSYTEIPEDQKIKVFARIGIAEESQEENE